MPPKKGDLVAFRHTVVKQPSWKDRYNMDPTTFGAQPVDLVVSVHARRVLAVSPSGDVTLRFKGRVITLGQNHVRVIYA